MHEQLGHPGMRKFKEMLKSTSILSENVIPIVNKLYENCLTCIKFQKSKPKPKVSPSLSTQFNETISIDLKIWPKYNKVILYIIDTFTRFTQAHILADKRPESVIKPLMDKWILNMFGAPQAIIMDNGGEFLT